jgi:demethylsterigmatocystin 6-O-methyltransferase
MSSACSKSDVSKLISELEALKHNVSIDEAQRQALCATLQEASLAVESPLETINRIIFSVSLSSRWPSIKS